MSSCSVIFTLSLQAQFVITLFNLYYIHSKQLLLKLNLVDFYEEISHYFFISY